MAREIYLKPELTDKEASELAGALLNDTSYKILIDYDADVYDEVSGNCIAKFRKNVIPANIAKTAYQNLKSAARATNNRNKASGKQGRKRLKTDGTISNTNHGDQEKAYGIIKFVDNKYSELMPEHYALQREVADNTAQDFVIKDTAFTTITVNKNWQTAVHTDKGDFEKGFGNLVVLREGLYKGGYFVIPQWAVAFDMQNCDLLLCDVHQWHGNTPITKVDEKATRISLVMYYRHNMQKCGTKSYTDFTGYHSRKLNQGHT